VVVSRQSGGNDAFPRAVTETAGFYNTVGFNDDTRAFLSIPARHDVARRMDCAFLAKLVAEHRLEEEEALEVAHDLAYRLVKQGISAVGARHGGQRSFRQPIAKAALLPGVFRMGLGRVRWTICAMLFVATSINYMDRQVIAILKPTLEHSIGMTEVSYGYIVDAFQIAYALGLLAAGRLIDKLGTRIGYMLVMAVWSLSAMGHALASTVLEFGFARFFSDSANPATSPPRSRPWPSGFRRTNAHWLRASSTPEQMLERSWLPPSCPG
jgi:hypothetical protein